MLLVWDPILPFIHIRPHRNYMIIITLTLVYYLMLSCRYSACSSSGNTNCNSSGNYGINCQDPNPHNITGGLVGGPEQNEAYTDAQSDYQHNEVALDYNAGFQTAVAGLLHLAKSCWALHSTDTLTLINTLIIRINSQILKILFHVKYM